MAYLVIAAYRPKPGQEATLLALVREHAPALLRLGLATPRPPLVLRAGDGTLLELFEWASREAVEKAHTHPDVLVLWERFNAVAEYVRLADLKEAGELFAHFEPVE